MNDFKQAENPRPISFGTVKNNQPVDTDSHFTKTDLIKLVKTKELPQIIYEVLSSPVSIQTPDLQRQIYQVSFSILKTIAVSIQTSYSKGEMFEMVSTEYHRYGIFAILIGNLS